jgi:hypothetical protein
MAGPINPDTILFDAPTKYIDGTAIPVGGIRKYEYGFGQASRVYTVIVEDTDMTPDEQGRQHAPITLAGALAFGQWYGVARAVSSDGKTSAWSNEASFEVAAREPEAPANFSVA